MLEKLANVDPVKEPVKVHAINQDSKIIIKNKAAFLDKKIPNYVSVLGVIGLLVLWQIVSKSGLVNEFTLPAPTTVLSTAWELISSGLLMARSFGKFVSDCYGVCNRLYFRNSNRNCVRFSKLGEKLGMPVINILYPIPKIAILPLIMLWLGIGEISKITVISLAVFFPMIYNTYTGVTQTNRLLLNVAITFGATKFDLIRKGYIP